MLAVALTAAVSACVIAPTDPVTNAPYTPTSAEGEECSSVSRETGSSESAGPFLRLYAPDSSVTADEEFSLYLEAVNLTGTVGSVTFTFDITLPPEISITGSDLETDNLGFTHNTITLNTGESREIGIHMKADAPPEGQQTENHRIRGEISWEAGDSDLPFGDCREVNITVSHKAVELTFDLSDLPDDADVRVASPNVCVQDNSCYLPYLGTRDLDINLSKGYRFVKYEYEGSEPENVDSKSTTIRLTKNTTIKPVVERVPVYTLTFRADPKEAGTVSAGGLSCSDGCVHPKDARLEINAKPNSGWVFVRWEHLGSEPSSPNRDKTGVTLEEDTIVTAVFKPERTLTVRVKGQGTVSSPSNCSDGCTQQHPEDTSVGITAEPDTGWKFVRWEYLGSKPNSLTAAKTDITLAKDTTVTSVFERAPVTLQVIVGDGGELDRYTFGNGCGRTCSGQFDYGSSVRIAADEDDGWDFDRWEVVSGNTPNGFDSSDEDHTITLNGDVTLRLRFARERENELSFIAGMAVGLETGYNDASTSPVGNKMNFGSPVSSSFIFDGSEVVVDAVFYSTSGVWGFHFSVASDIEEELASEGYSIQIYNESSRNAPVQVSLSDMAFSRNGYLHLHRRTHPAENEAINRVIATGEPFFAKIIPPDAAPLPAVTLTLITEGEGTVSPSSCRNDGCEKTHGDRVNITAKPDTDWDFVRWEYSGSKPNRLTAAGTDITLTEDTTVTAVFERAPVTLTLTTSKGGTATPSSCRDDGCERDYRDKVNITAKPDTGWNFVRWEYSGSKPNRLTAAGTNITLTEDTKVTPVFERAPVTLQVIVGDGGELDRYTFGNGCGRTCSGQFNYGSSVRIAADEDSGWDFDRWEVVSGDTPNGFDSNDEDHTITLNGDVTLRLRFARERENELSFIAGMAVGLETGYNDASTSPVVNKMNFGSSVASSFIFDGGEVVVDAIFYSTSGVWGFHFSVASDIEEELASEGYFIQVYNEASRNDPVQVSLSDMAFSRNGYLHLHRRTHPAENEAINRVIATGEPFFAKIIPPDAAPLPAVTLTLITEGEGTVSPSSCRNDGCEKTHGERVNITAKPDTDWDFVRWEYSGSKPDRLTAAGTDITLTEDTAVTAVFERAPVTLTLTTSKGGTATPSSCRDDGCERDYRDKVNITATPDTGWNFVRWEYSGSKPNRLTAAGTNITLTEDTKVTPVFERVRVTLRVIVGDGGELDRYTFGNGCGRTCSGQFDHGSSVRIAADEDNGWDFDGWEVVSGNTPNGFDSSDEDHTITLNGDVTLRLRFAREQEAERPLCSSIPVTECEALADLYNATDGDNWTNNSGWLNGGDPNQWRGVRVLSGRVTEINLRDNNLTGELPASIGTFTNLTRLDLSSNRFRGELPAEIGNLTNLAYLYLSYNEFSGELPPEIGNLTNLTSLTRRTNLTLDLRQNKFSGELPPEIGNLTNLTALYLSNNEFSGELPPEIGNLTNLTRLTRRTNLTLDLRQNDFSGELPPEIGNLTNLDRLFLYGNNFSGELPSEIGNLTNLDYLGLRGNDFSGELPPEIGNLANLTWLNLRDNSFSGELPPEIGNLTNLHSLYLGKNKFSGELPPEIGNLTNLTWLLDLGDNSFSGELPPEIGNLTNLTRLLDLRDNSFSGELPPEIGNLTNLYSLYLSKNKFSGELPTEIGNLTDLRNLSLSSNSFSGELPPQIGNLVDLEVLRLHNNSFSGELPTEIGNLVNLELLWIYNNNFSGPLPSGVCDRRADFWTLSVDPQNRCPDTEDTTVTPVFERAPVTLILGTGAGGTVSPASCRNNGCEKTHGDRVNITAKPNTGWTFVRWEYSGSKPNRLTAAGTDITLTEDTTVTPVFERAPVTLTLTTSEGGTATPSSCRDDGCERDYKDRVNITATPNTGWNFVRWEFAGSRPNSLTAAGTSITLTEDTTVTPVFERATVTLILGTGEGGTVSPSSCLNDGCEKTHGDRANITATPNTGWTFVRWEYSGSKPNSLTDAGTSITLTEDTTVTPVFERVRVTLRVIVGDGGELDRYTFGNGCGRTCSGQFDYGSSVRIAADEDNGWDFDGWEVVSGDTPNGFDSNDEDHTITLNGDVTLRLRFAREQEAERPLCSGIPVTECEALADLYNATDGDNWKNNSGWLNGGDPNQWEGVRVLSGRVTEIDLKDNKLTGELPASIGTFTNLTRLYLDDNNFSGELPTEIGNLGALTRLYLYNNNFNGELPTEIGDLVNLELLRLDNNNFSGELPTEIGDLVNLELLRLDNNNFSGELPTEIGNLGTLTRLHLYNNNFSGELPTEIGDLVNLETLNLFNNGFNGELPIEIADLVNLEVLRIDNNNFSGELPTEIGNLAKLTRFYLYNNNFSGELPTEIGNLVKLEILNLLNNNFSGRLPTETGSLVKLEILRLDNNNFSGELPTQIGNLVNLTRLNLRNNNFSGPLPSGICDRRADFWTLTVDPQNRCPDTEDTTVTPVFERVTLRVIVGDGGELDRYTFGNGCGRTCSGQFDHGSSVRIAADEDSGWDFDRWEVVSGDTPNGFDSNDEDHTITLNGDVTLRLRFAREQEAERPLCSGIPVTECEALADLYNATDGDNWTNNSGWLNGGDPNQWEGVRVLSGRVTEIDLRGNNLTGELPASIGTFTNLTRLHIVNSRFSRNGYGFRGKLPAEIGNLTNLTLLALHSNEFSGELPPEIGNLTNLTRLYLGDNKFSGELPPEIGNLTNLTSLFLDENKFSGELPPEIGNLTNLDSLALSYNDFSGELPPEIGNLTSLARLYLSNNKFSGELPPEIGNLTNLTWLYLRQNEFSGELPPEIGNLANLDYLALSYNDFSEELPPEIGNLTDLHSLYLSNNKFSGELPPEIGNLTNLTSLDLRHNKFSGELPTEIGNLTNLHSLYLSRNNFSGSLPAGVCDRRADFRTLLADPQNDCP